MCADSTSGSSDEDFVGYLVVLDDTVGGNGGSGAAAMCLFPRQSYSRISFSRTLHVHSCVFFCFPHDPDACLVVQQKVPRVLQKKQSKQTERHDSARQQLFLFLL